MKEEYESIMKNDAWELKNFLKNKVPIRFKLLFKSNFSVVGSIDKYKDILVANGYSQKKGMHF